ncbi:TonB-dependent receptor [Chitinophaga rupis]|nr:TonB-dependent receptor [Chitinophaga rupis]
MRTGNIISMFLLLGVQLLQGAVSRGQYPVEKIDLAIQRRSLKEAFTILQQQSGVLFIYNEQAIAPYKAVSLNARQRSLDWVVNELLRNTRLTYKVQNNKVIILEKEVKAPAVKMAVAADPADKRKGRVTDAKGAPLPGVTVQVKGANRGAVTDGEGVFFLQVAESEVLVCSISGYVTQEIPAGSGEISVVLQEDIKGLEEVVVVGYGTQKKREVTGAIVSVQGKELAAQPITNPIQGLKGKVAGLDVFTSGNEPGGSANILIRGERSMNGGNAPLLVLDGIPVMDASFNEINPNDIASIEVLKDAASSAIYGSRGANGVILITTKRGQAGRSVINYDAYYGITSITRKLDLMDGQQFAKLRREAARGAAADGNGPIPPDDQLFDAIALESLAKGRSTDWQDLVYHQGSRQNHQLSITGGKEKTQFAVSLNYFRETGIIDKTDYTRGSIRINLDHQVNDRIRMGVSTFVTRSEQNVADNTVFDDILRTNPLGVPYDSAGNMLFRPNNDEGQRVNPLMVIKNTIDERYKTRVFASVYGEWDILKDLTYRLNVGPELEVAREGIFKGSLTDANQGGNATASTFDQDRFSITVENILRYKHRINKDHNLSVTLLQSSQQQITNSAGINVNKLPYEAQGYHNLGSAGEVTGVSSDYSKSLLLSYMARVNYDYKNRYLLTLTARADGSSVFAPGHKWGYFPSAAAAWRIDAEPFMQSLRNISALKLRVSYGSNGNNPVNPYGTFSLLTKGVYAFGETGANGFVPYSIANPNLQWETTRELNMGIDFGLFNDRISGSVEHYISNTKNILLTRSIPSSTGYTNIVENIGATRNNGWEVSLSTINVSTKSGFQWRTDFSFSANQNKIVQLYGDGKNDLGNSWIIGQPINIFYYYKKTGIWQTSEATEAAALGFKPGMIKIADVNNDKTLNDQDRVVIGNQRPAWLGGVTSHFTYRGLDLSVIINTRQHYLIYSQWYDNNNRLAGRYNNLDVDYWTPENPTNDNPQPNKNQESVYLGQTLAMKDASFVRVKNIGLSYTLPQVWLQRSGIRSLKINLSAENPFTFTHYKGQDPEFESDGTRAMYPTVKMYAVGLNAAF